MSPFIEYDPALVEEAVTAALEVGPPGWPALRIERLRWCHRRALDAVYERPPEAREKGFRRHFDEMFERLELHRLLPPLLEPFPRFRDRLDRVLVRRRREPESPTVQLREHRERRGTGEPAYLLIAVTPSCFMEPGDLRTRLLPELQRAHDLLEPSFAPTGGPEIERWPPSVRDAYQRLWQLSSHARLVSRNLMSLEQGDDLERRASVLLASATEDEDGPDRWSEPPSAAELVARLSDPESVDSGLLLDLAVELCSGRPVSEGDRLETETATGGPRASDGCPRCPLCGLPSGDWADALSVDEAAPAIREDVPDWSPGVGACVQCVERYRLPA